MNNNESANIPLSAIMDTLCPRYRLARSCAVGNSVIFCHSVVCAARVNSAVCLPGIRHMHGDSPASPDGYQTTVPSLSRRHLTAISFLSPQLIAQRAPSPGQMEFEFRNFDNECDDGGVRQPLPGTNAIREGVREQMEAAGPWRLEKYPPRSRVTGLNSL